MHTSSGTLGQSFVSLAVPKCGGWWVGGGHINLTFLGKIQLGQLHEVKRYLPCSLCPVWLLMKVISLIQSAVPHVHMASLSLDVMLLIVKPLFVYLYP